MQPGNAQNLRLETAAMLRLPAMCASLALTITTTITTTTGSPGGGTDMV